MSNETLFYVFGVVLVLAALGISFTGIRTKQFPPRPVLLGLTTLFAAIVIGTAFYSVLNAEDEQEHREHELAAEESEAEADVGKAEEGKPAPDAGQTAAATEVALTSPEDGSLSFSPDGVEAPAGNITIEYDNPSPADHNVAVELEGKVVGESDTVAGADATLKPASAAPGEYTYDCTIPGHREAGMEGDLTVTGPEKP